MATNTKDQEKIDRSIKSAENKTYDFQNHLDAIYQQLYSTDISGKQQLDGIVDDISQSINSILSTNSDIQGLPDISQLYARILKKNGELVGNSKIINGLMDIMSNDSLMNTLIADPEINRYIKQKDLQIDMILKYMPKLAEALNVKKDNVLSADNFNKSFLNAINKALTQQDDQDEFARNANALIKKYRLEQKFEKIYDETAKYGEQFIYIVPYKRALERLQNNRNSRRVDAWQAGVIESVDLIKNGALANPTDHNKVITDGTLKSLKEDLSTFKGNITLHMNEANILDEVLVNYVKALEVQNKNKGKSLYESFVEEMEASKLNEGEEAIAKMSDTGDPLNTNGIRTNSLRPAERVSMDRIMPDELEYDKIYNHANDGLVDPNGVNAGKLDDIPGCVFKVLKHENVIPVYIEDICLGYYYLEFRYGDPTDDIDRSKMLLNNTFDTFNRNDMRDDHDMVLKYIANKISNSIDNKFINANQDLKEEIFTILKYNRMFDQDFNTNEITVTYLPPQDLYHFYFDIDDILHRGISDLDKALIPALFWVLLELSTTMGIASRSQDHRLFYVRQNVETNIAKTMLNVINQIKKGNMGIRQVQSINSILGIIGKYNDFVIPVGPNGEAAVTFDTLQGQQIETPTDLLNKYEENAVNATDVPLEIVNSTNQADYATRYVMQNSKFLRKILKRQAIVEEKFSEMFMRVYNFEYGTNEKNIKIQLPTPIFLSSVNGLALINSVTEYAKAQVELEYPEGTEFDDKEKAIFGNLIIRQLLSVYVDFDNMDRIRDQVKMQLEADKKTEQKDTTSGEGEEEMGEI